MRSPCLLAGEYVTPYLLRRGLYLGYRYTMTVDPSYAIEEAANG